MWTSASRLPAYVTLMHLLTDSPGFALLMLYIAAPASLSAIATVPAVIVLPALVVVALKAPNAPIAARLPSAPTQSAVSRAFVVVFTAYPPWWFTGARLSPLGARSETQLGGTSGFCLKCV